MFEQIIYTSCCKGRVLKDGEPSGKNGGLQVYSFSKKLLDRFPRVHCDEIETMIATRCLWHFSCEARAYAYTLLSDGSRLWNCNRESKPIAGESSRTYHFSQGYIGEFDVPAAFNMGAANWLTDEDIRNTEGMSDVVYGMNHDYDCSTAPQAEFIPLADTLPISGNLVIHLQRLQSIVDQDTCTKHLLDSIHWLIEHANDDRSLLIVVPTKHDNPPRFPGDDTRSPENVLEAQSICESIMWIISYLLPASAATTLPFTVGMEYNWLRRNIGHYRICVTADEPNDAMKQLLAQGKVDVLKWNSKDKQLNTTKVCAPYDKWIIDSLSGKPRPLIDFKGFCEHLSDLRVSSMLYTIAYIYQAQNNGGFENIPAATLKNWLNVLESTDYDDWYRELRSDIVTTLYRDYAGVLNADMQNDFAILQEMIMVSERYDHVLKDIYTMPIVAKMEEILQDTVHDHSETFARLLQLQKLGPDVFVRLQSNIIEKANACVNVALNTIPKDSVERQKRLDAILYKQSWPGMIGKLDFIDHMLEGKRFNNSAEARVIIYESALFGVAVNKGVFDALYQKYSREPLEVLNLLTRFERRCEPPASGVKILYNALIKMIENVQSGPNADIFKAMRVKNPEGVENLINIWMRKDLLGTFQMCATVLNDYELSVQFGRLMDFNNPKIVMAIIQTMPCNYTQTVAMVQQRISLYAQRNSFYQIDYYLIDYYRELRKRSPGQTRIHKIELMELVQAFLQNATIPDVLYKQIYTWKREYDRRTLATKTLAFYASIDIEYFEQCENELPDFLNCLKAVIVKAIQSLCKEAPKKALAFGKSYVKNEAACNLIDLCLSLFVNMATDQTLGHPSVSAKARIQTAIQEQWLAELPSIVWNQSSDWGVSLLLYLLKWKEEFESFPATIKNNYGKMRNNLLEMLSSIDEMSNDEWTYIVEEVRSYNKRIKDVSLEDLFAKLDFKRKSQEHDRRKRQPATTSVSPSHQPQMETVAPAPKSEEKKAGGMSIIGRLFGDRKDPKKDPK